MKRLLLISTVSLLAAGHAFAQDAAEQPGAAAAATAPAAEATTTASVTIGDDELKRFAAVAAATQKIMAEHQPKIAAATDADAKAKAEEAMSGDLQVAVVDNGFTVKRYNEIATAMQKDQALFTRMTELAGAAPAATTNQ